MRSAAIAAFAGLASAAYVVPPSYDAPAPVYSSVEAEVSSAPVSYPADQTEYSTVYATITSCAPEVTNCPAESTVVESSVVPLTTSTIYSTQVHTVHECPETVVDCPYESKTEYVVTETIAISTTVCPVTEAEPTPTSSEGGDKPYPPVEVPTKSAGVPEESGPVYPPVAPSTAEGNKPVHSTAAYPPLPTYPAPPAEELCPSESVKTVVYTTEITTVIPTVITKVETATLSVPCAEETKPAGSVPVPPPHVPTGNNATTPAVPTGTAPVEAGAAGVSGSVLVAALAAVAAYAFA